MDIQRSEDNKSITKGFLSAIAEYGNIQQKRAEIAGQRAKLESDILMNDFQAKQNFFYKMKEKQLDREMDYGAPPYPGMQPESVTRGGVTWKSQKANAMSMGQTSDEEIQNAAQGIIDGNIPPDVSKTTSFRDRTRITAALQEQGFNLSQANSEWNATQKFLNSMNSEKQVRLRQAISSVKDALGGLEQISAELNQSSLAPLNKAQLAIKANSGDPLAVKYLGQINIIRDELAQVFMGGNSPTDKALDLARETIDKNWSPKQLQEAINNVRTNLSYRENAINNATAQGIGNQGNQETGTRYLPGQKSPNNFIEGKIYRDKNGNKATYKNGQFIPM